ncbi:MAG: flagellar basal body P-ring formation chaperone FlgA [Nitrospinota bacterium]
MIAERSRAIRIPLLALLASAGLLAQGTALAGEKVECLVRKRARVTAKTVRVSDIARCTGGPAEIRRRILNTPVGQALGPGRDLRLDPDWVLVKIRRQGVDRGQIVWKAPRTVIVATAHQRLEREALERAFREFVVNQTPWPPEDVRILNVQAKEDLILPAGDVRLKVEPPRQSRILGRVQLPVRVFVDGRPVRRVYVTGEIRVSTRVWVLDRPVRRGHVFTAVDLRQMEVDLESGPAGIVRDRRQVVGKRARRSIRGRVPIRSGWLERVPLIRRGDVVTLKAESERFLITTVGLARTDGALGDLVEVMNLASKKSVYGRVVDARTVNVLF